MVSAMINEEAALQPLSNDTTEKQIHILSASIKEKLLLEKSLQILIFCFVTGWKYRYNKATHCAALDNVSKRNISSDTLFISALVYVTDEEEFNNLNEFNLMILTAWNALESAQKGYKQCLDSLLDF